MSLNNTNGTLSAVQSLPQRPSRITLYGLISGGNLFTDALGEIIFTGGGLNNASATGNLVLPYFGNVSFQNSTLGGNLTQPGATVTLSGTITNNANWTQTSNANTVYFGDSTILTGNGTVTLLFGNLICSQGGAKVTIGAHQTVQGNGFTSNSLYIVNDGTVNAKGSGFFAVESTFTNNGLAEATNHGALEFNQDPANLVNGTLTGGTWSVSDGGVILFRLGSLTTNAATLYMTDYGSGFPALETMSRNLGCITITNGFNAYSDINLTNAGTFLVGPSTTLTMPQFIMDGGTLGGSGTVAASALAGAGPHTIRPGMPNSSAPATLTISSLTTNPNTTLSFRLLAPSLGTAASSNDQLLLTTSLNVEGGTIAVSPQSGGLPTPGYYQLLHIPNGFTGSLASITLPAASNSTLVYTLDVSRDPGFIDLHAGYLGDANDDGHVDLNDLNTVLNNLGTTTSAWTSGNFDGAPTIDLNDLNAVLNNLGTSYPNNALIISAESLLAAAPEPASLSLLTVALPLLLTRRRRA